MTNSAFNAKTYGAIRENLLKPVGQFGSIQGQFGSIQGQFGSIQGHSEHLRKNGDGKAASMGSGTKEM